MKKLRMLCNMMVDVDREGINSRELIRFGQLFDTKFVQISDDEEFADIHLDDGGIIYGINRGLFEANQTEVRPYVAVQLTLSENVSTTEDNVEEN